MVRKYQTAVVLLLAAIAFIEAGCSALFIDRAAERRHSYVEQHPDLDRDTKARILDGRIGLGMRASDVIASWGPPHERNRSVGSWGVHEQWVYGRIKYYGAGVSGFVPTKYLYFENGVLRSWQD